MGLYLDAKIAISDGVCAVLKPVTPDLFSSSCSRFIDGLLVTVELLGLAVVLGFAIALVVALARGSEKAYISVPAYVYTYIFRGTPILVQLWVFYYGLGSLGADGLGPLWVFFKDAWWVGLLVLTLNTAAYVAEILRGGIAAVPRGQVEAAKSMGLPWHLRMRKVIFPQALRIAWPAYGNEIVLLMKASALVSTITVLDLMGQIRTIFSRSYSLDVFVYGAVLYLVLATLITLALKLVERRLAIPGH